MELFEQNLHIADSAFERMRVMRTMWCRNIEEYGREGKH